MVPDDFFVLSDDHKKERKPEAFQNKKESVLGRNEDEALKRQEPERKQPVIE